MADYERSEVTRTRVEYAIPSGSNVDELGKAVGDALVELGEPAAAASSARVDARDGQIVIWYERTEPSPRNGRVSDGAAAELSQAYGTASESGDQRLLGAVAVVLGELEDWDGDIEPDDPLEMCVDCNGPHLCFRHTPILTDESTRVWRWANGARELVDQLARYGDDLLFTGKQCRPTATALTQALAAASFNPGGVRFAGIVWCAEHYPWGTAACDWPCDRCAPPPKDGAP